MANNLVLISGKYFMTKAVIVMENIIETPILNICVKITKAYFSEDLFKSYTFF